MHTLRVVAYTQRRNVECCGRGLANAPSNMILKTVFEVLGFPTIRMPPSKVAAELCHTCHLPELMHHRSAPLDPCANRNHKEYRPTRTLDVLQYSSVTFGRSKNLARFGLFSDCETLFLLQASTAVHSVARIDYTLRTQSVVAKPRKSKLFPGSSAIGGDQS